MGTDRTSGFAAFVALALVIVVAGSVSLAATGPETGNVPNPPLHPVWDTGPPDVGELRVPSFDTDQTQAIGDPSLVVESEWPHGSGILYRHPTVIARHIHSIYERWLEGDASAHELRSFATHSEYLLTSQQRRSHGDTEYGVWPLPMPLPEFGVGSGWLSGFTNAAGALAMAQAAAVLPDQSPEFLEAARLGAAALDISVDDGGLSRFTDSGTCFEEVAHPAEPTCILNGHLYAMGYLHSLVRGGVVDAVMQLSQAEAYVLEHLSEYRTSFASKYHPTGKYAEPDGYNRVHGNQLLWLYAQTGRFEYFDAAAQFAQFDGSGHVVAIAASQPVDADRHGQGVLVDGPAWFGYWSSRQGPWIELELDDAAPVCGFNLFYVSEAVPTDVAALLDGSPLPIASIESDTRGPAEFRTTVVSYRFDRCTDAKDVRVEFASQAGSVVAVREADVIVASASLADARLADMYEDRKVSRNEELVLRAHRVYP